MSTHNIGFYEEMRKMSFQILMIHVLRFLQFTIFRQVLFRVSDKIDFCSMKIIQDIVMSEYINWSFMIEPCHFTRGPMVL